MGGISIDNKVVNGGQVPKLSSGSGAPFTNGIDHEIYLDWQNNNLWQWAVNSWNLITSGVTLPQDLNTTLVAGNITDQPAIFQTTTDDTIISPTGLIVLGATQVVNVNESLISIGNGTNIVKLTISGISYQNSTKELLIGLGFVPTTKDYVQKYMSAEGYLLCGTTGRATLVGGTKTISLSSDTPITANSTFQFSINTPGGTIGVQYQGIYLTATSFKIVSLQTTGAQQIFDTSTLDYTVITIE
jgi:hypothetical protein